MRDNLIPEKHNGGLGGHLGAVKTFGQLRHFHFLPKMRSEVEKFVRRCKLCQNPKGIS